MSRRNPRDARPEKRKSKRKAKLRRKRAARNDL